jgi:hypothetical protein
MAHPLEAVREGPHAGQSTDSPDGRRPNERALLPALGLRVALATDARQARGTPRLLRGTFGPDACAIGGATLPLFFNSFRADILKAAGIEPPEMGQGSTPDDAA